jgi:transposase
MTTEYRTVEAKFRMPDEMWIRIEALLPKFRRSRKGGRPRLEWRRVMDGIFYVLRTGCQWKALPPEFGSGSSAHRYFQLLVKRKLFRDLWMVALEEYDDLQGIDWEWQSMDGAMTKAPLGGKKNGPESDRSSEVRHQAELTHRGERSANWIGRLRSKHARQAAGRGYSRQHAVHAAAHR